MFKLDLEKSEEPEIKLSTFVGSSKKQESSRKTSTSVLLTMPKTDCVDHSKLWKILKETGIAGHLTCFLRNLYAGEEATVRTGHETMDWFQIGKGVRQGFILSPCFFKLICRVHHLKYRMDEAQARIKMLGKISISSDMQMIPTLWQKAKRNLKAS